MPVVGRVATGMNMFKHPLWTNFQVVVRHSAMQSHLLQFVCQLALLWLQDSRYTTLVAGHLQNRTMGNMKAGCIVYETAAVW